VKFGSFGALKYVGNFIGSNPFEPEPDQNRGPVQSSGIWLNRTVGPVQGSHNSGKNRTDPTRGITRWMWACIPPTSSSKRTARKEPIWRQPRLRATRREHRRLDTPAYPHTANDMATPGGEDLSGNVDIQGGSRGLQSFSRRSAYIHPPTSSLSHNVYSISSCTISLSLIFIKFTLLITWARKELEKEHTPLHHICSFFRTWNNFWMKSSGKSASGCVAHW
jgi:hypothetical protein